MHKKEIIHILTTKYKRLNELLQQVNAGFDQHDIYLFRQEIKKLKAFLHLLATEAYHNKGLQLQGKLKKLYASAGTIRDIDLHLAKIHSEFSQGNKPPNEYLRLLRKEAKKERAIFHKIYSEKKSFRPQKAGLAKKRSSLDQQQVDLFCKLNLSDSVSRSSGKKIADRQVHDVRKNIKNMLYIARLLQPANEDNKATVIQCNHAWLADATAVAHDLGVLNDLSVGLLLLQPAYLDKISAAERKQLEVVEKKWRQEKKELKATLLPAVHARLQKWLPNL